MLAPVTLRPGGGGGGTGSDDSDPAPLLPGGTAQVDQWSGEGGPCLQIRRRGDPIGGGWVKRHIAVIELRPCGSLRRVHEVGVDCPLGWPHAFVDFISAHHSSTAMNRAATFDQQWRRSLAYRMTDEVARHSTGLIPPSAIPLTASG